MEVGKVGGEAGKEEAQSQHNHDNPYHSRKENPASTQASVNRVGRGRSHSCLRLHISSVHLSAPLQLRSDAAMKRLVQIRCCLHRDISYPVHTCVRLPHSTIALSRKRYELRDFSAIRK